MKRCKDTVLSVIKLGELVENTPVRLKSFSRRLIYVLVHNKDEIFLRLFAQITRPVVLSGLFQDSFT